jgi:hypothetical protein
MTLRTWISLTLIVFSCFHTSVSSAQQSSRNVKRGVATVLFSTLGGAILGLSTLSFYGEPQEHTENITTGALIGALAGGGYLLYASSQPQPAPVDYTQSFDEQLKNKKALASAKAPVLISYQFDF